MSKLKIKMCVEHCTAADTPNCLCGSSATYNRYCDNIFQMTLKTNIRVQHRIDDAPKCIFQKLCCLLIECKRSKCTKKTPFYFVFFDWNQICIWFGWDWRFAACFSLTLIVYMDGSCSFLFFYFVDF